MVRNDMPQTYHKSFYDFLTTADHCTEDVRIDLKAHHTRIAIRCFHIMNKKLKRNILDLGSPACFMDNEVGLAVQGITEDQLDKQIPAELQYACVYWKNHVDSADTDDAELVKMLKAFARKHLVHWLEALSWVSKLDIAHRVLLDLRKVLVSHHY